MGEQNGLDGVWAEKGARDSFAGVVTSFFFVHGSFFAPSLNSIFDMLG